MIDKRWYLIVPGLEEELEKDNNELPVHCAYHDDSKISASINTETNLFYCQTCGAKGSLVGLLKKKFGFYNEELLDVLLEHENIEFNQKYIKQDVLFNNKIAMDMNFHQYTLGEVGVFKNPNYPNSYFSVPVFIEEILFDVRTYFPNGTPKWISERGSKTGLIVPYNVWKQDKERFTLICAGEKDMLMARSWGFNAICLTGGEARLPFNIDWFRNRDVVIAYDNDDAGIKGAAKLAKNLMRVVHSLKNLTNFHNICVEKGEDIYDFFVKYQRNGQDLQNLINLTPLMAMEDIQEELYKDIKLIKFQEALGKPENYGNFQKSIIKIKTDLSPAYIIPQEVKMTYSYQLGAGDIENESGKAEMRRGEPIIVKIDPEDLPNILDYKKKSEKDRKAYLGSLLTEQVRMKNPSYKKIMPDPNQQYLKDAKKFNIYAVGIASLIQSSSEPQHISNQKIIPAYFTSIAIPGDNPFLVGDELEIVYKIFHDPTKQNEQVVLIYTISKKNSFIDNFIVSKDVIASLIKFQPTPFLGNAYAESMMKLEELLKRARSFIGNYVHLDLYLANELMFHSVLNYNKKDKEQYGVLDIMIIGNSEAGKSTTSIEMIKKYNVGQMLGLRDTTEIAILGGIAEFAGEKVIKPGLIPNSHRKALILEEFQTANPKIISYLRNYRTSKQVSINRIQGEMVCPANVRSLIISNAFGGRRVESFTRGGVEIIQSLITDPPDVGRFDFILVIGNQKIKDEDDNDGVLEPFYDEDYQNRVKWVWSRKPENIIFSNDFELKIKEKWRYIEKRYNTEVLDPEFLIFGKHIQPKLRKIAIAFACILVSTNDFHNVLVNEEHLELAVWYLESIYDSEEFALLKEIERNTEYSASALTKEDIDRLTRWNNAVEGEAIRFLYTYGSTTRDNIRSILGATMDDTNNFINSLNLSKFIKLDDKKIYITNRFKAGFKKMKRAVPQKVV